MEAGGYYGGIGGTMARSSSNTGNSAQGGSGYIDGVDEPKNTSTGINKDTRKS